MRVALVAQKYPPIVGGGETHLQNLAEGLAELGIDVTVLTGAPSTSTDLEKCRSGSVKVEEIAGFHEAAESLDCKECVRALYRHVSRDRWDVVHVFNHVPAMLISWMRESVTARLCVSLFETHIPGVRVFDLWRDYELESALQRTLVRQLRADRMIAGSQAYRRWAIRGGFDDERIVVIPFATSVRRFAEGASARARERKRLGLHDEFAFLVPARLVERKRIETAVYALSKVVAKSARARLMLMSGGHASDGQYATRLRNLIEAKGLANHVAWVPETSWHGMPGVYAASDAVLLPSSHEGFGIALIEAMAARKPVLTTDVEGHDEVVRDRLTGYLTAPDDVDALVSAMEEVMTQPQEAIVERAYSTVADQFDLSTMVRRHAETYGALCSGSERT